MTDRSSGLPADILESDGSRSVQTSTTNIGAYMWSAVAARRLGIISRRELVARLSRTIATLERMERYEDTGQYYNWYDHRTGAKLTAGRRARRTRSIPILSSVDNGWLAVGLKIVARSVSPWPGARGRSTGRWTSASTTCPRETGCCSTSARTTRRVALLLRHAGQREPHRRLHRNRARPAAPQDVLRALAHVPGHVRLRLPGDQAVGEWRRYLGVDVFEGAYRYQGTLVCPPGAARCSRRSCRPCSCPRRSGRRGVGAPTTR